MLLEKVYKKELVILTALGSRKHWLTVIKGLGTTRSLPSESLYSASPQAFPIRNKTGKESKAAVVVNTIYLY